MERFSDRAIEIIDELHTERLDYKSEYIPLIDCAQRCAAYEDTGLAPEEITVKPYPCIFYCNRRCTLDNDWCAEGPGCQKEMEKEKAAHILELAQAERDGRCVVLPCKVGDTVFVIEKCENVTMNLDDDYFTGTGAIECPFENSCDVEDCQDDHIRIFETMVTDFWFGEENGNHPEVFLEYMGRGYMRSGFGKTIFFTREEAEAALSGKLKKENINEISSNKN